MVGRMPKISVIMPAYNHEKFVGEAIQSVLNQTFQDFELIIVDDGSQDKTLEQIKKFSDSRIKLILHERNLGAAVAMRTCLENAIGQYIAVISSDDVFLSNKLERQILFLETHPQYSAVFTLIDLIDETGNSYQDRNHKYYRLFVDKNRNRFEWLNYFFYDGNCLCHPTVLIKKECYDEIGYYDERLAQLPDFDFWIRLCLKYNLYILPEKLLKFRILSNERNTSGDSKESNIRTHNELSWVYENYLEIATVQEFLKIFPDVSLNEQQTRSIFIPFLIARLAYSSPHLHLQKLGLDILRKSLKDPILRENIQKTFDFSYSDFIKISGGVDSLNRYVDWNTTLYIDSGNGFNEHEKLKLNVDFNKSNFNFIFDLSHYPTIKSLRWDPVESQMCEILIKNIFVKDETFNIHQFDLNSLKFNADYKKLDILYFNTLDPQILLQIQGKILSLQIQGDWNVFSPKQTSQKLWKLLNHKEQKLQDQEQKLQDQEQKLQDQEQKLQDQEQKLQDQEQKLQDQEQKLQDQEQKLQDQEQKLQDQEQKLLSMEQSITWQLTTKFNKNIIERCFPQNTRRSHYYNLALKGGRIILHEGIDGFGLKYRLYRKEKQKVRTSPSPVLYSAHESQRNFLIEECKQFMIQPKISILMATWNSDEKWLRIAIESIINQIYSNWELCISDGASNDAVRNILHEYIDKDSRIHVKYLPHNLGISGNLNEALSFANGDYITFVDHDDELPDTALFQITKVINDNPDVEIIYSDDDKIDENGTHYDFQYKPDWNPELLLSYCYISHIKVYKQNIIAATGHFNPKFDGAQDYDYILRATEKTNKVVHIPSILYHWRSIKGSTAYSSGEKPASLERGRLAVEEAIKRRGIDASVLIPDFALKCKCGIYKLDFKFNEYPCVTIIIPIKDKVNLLKALIRSIEEKSLYPNYKILIIDTGSTEKETLDFLNALPYEVVQHNQSLFNFSNVINFAVKKADSEYILFLNNDTEVISPTWLHELVGCLQMDKDIAAVGAKLIYKDERIQHAGVILGLNNDLAGHANKLRYYGDGGYLNYANVLRDFSAVTAACMLTKKSCFAEVGGFDETLFAVAYNDVDYCLKLRKKGYRIVYNPYVLLYHFEGKTRGTGENIDNPREENNFRSKWENLLSGGDPYYNPNLSLRNELFEIKPKVKKILFISHNFNFEGGPISFLLLVHEMIKQGYECIVFSPHDGPLRNEYMKSGVLTKVIPGLFNETNSPILQEIENNHFDIVYLNTIMTFPIIPLLKKYKLPIIWIIRESERDYYFHELPGLKSDYFEIVDKVVFVSHATRNIYSELEYKNNFVVIPNGINVSKIDQFKHTHSKDELKRNYGYEKDDILISVIGTTCERKGQKYFVDAAIQYLAQTQKMNVRFLIVGGRESSYLDLLRTLIKSSDYKENIHIIPETPEAFNYYRMSDIFVCSSLIESLPRVILEAMAFGLPIISTNVYGIPEMIENGKSGMLIDPARPDILKEKIIELISDPDLMKFLAQNANNCVRKRFGLSIMGTKYEYVQNNLLR
jgi:glycosyltransferase involved in cell wall biosynthesis